MMLTFFDRQDSSNPINGRTLSETTELLESLDALRDRPPFFCELAGDNGYSLYLGIGVLGCAQYSRSDGSAPYLMAVNTSAEKSEYVSFLTAGTSTPVQCRYCLPFAVIKQVAAYFAETGDRYPSLIWEEI